MTPNIGKLYIKSKLSERQIDTYQFRVRVMTDERNDRLKSQLTTFLAPVPSTTQRRQRGWDRDYRRLRSLWLAELRGKEAIFWPNMTNGTQGLQPPTPTIASGTTPTQGLTFRDLLSIDPRCMRALGLPAVVISPGPS